MASYHSFGSINSIDDTNVIVIGAGISGLTAAYELTKRDSGLRVIVLEATARVGGRTYTASLKTGEGQTDNFDFGGQWVSSLHSQLLKLLKNLELEIFPRHCGGRKVGKAGVPIWKTFTYFPLLGSWYTRYELYRFIHKIEGLVGQISLNDPMNFKEAQVLDSMTMETYLLKHLYSLSGRDVMRTVLRMQFGAESTDVSVLFFLFHCRTSLGFLNQFMNTEKTVRQYRIKGGAQQIAHRLVEKIGKQLVMLEDPVVQIVQDDYFVYALTAAGNVYRGERLILAIPPTEILRIEFKPPLPTRLKYLLQRFLPGHVTQFVLTYKKPYWREEGCSGEILDYGGSSSCGDTSPFTTMCDVTTENGCAGLMGQLSSYSGLEWSGKKEWLRKEAILTSMSQLWGEWAKNPIDYLEVNWSEEKYVGGCPRHHLGPGMMGRLNSIQKPFQRIHWAGSESANRWMGYMNGAVLSGFRACIEVLYELRPQVLTTSDMESFRKDILENGKLVTPKYPFIYRLMYGNPFCSVAATCIVLYYLIKMFSRNSI